MYLLDRYKIAIKFDLCAKLKITCTCCSLIFSEKHSVRCPDGTHLACFRSLSDIATTSTSVRACYYVLYLGSMNR